MSLPPYNVGLVVVFAFLNVDDPWVAWLVYRGEVASAGMVGEPGALSYWHAKYLFDAAGPRARAAHYRAELDIERVRAASYPEQVSRLRGLYFFEDEGSARRAGERWDGNFVGEHLAEVELIGRPRISRYDSNWITQRMFHADRSWIPDYLAGRSFGPHPLWELLVEGRGYVLGTRVRKPAYETLKGQWLESLGLLELSRVAVELGSDFGLHVPILSREGDVARLRMHLNFGDAKNPEFLKRLQNYEGSKNTADLNPNSDLVLPDLSAYYAEFQINP